MAKKNYIKLEAYHTSVAKKDADNSIMTIKGRNTRGTSIEVKVQIDDYFFKYIIKEMTGIVRNRVKHWNEILNDVKKAVEPNE